MNKFIANQKVKYIGDTSIMCGLTHNGIYNVIAIKNNSQLRFLSDNWRIKEWDIRDFRTIVQGVEDVVIGMTLTLNNSKEVIVYKTIKNKNLVLATIRGILLTAKIEEFKEYEPKIEYVDHIEGKSNEITNLKVNDIDIKDLRGMVQEYNLNYNKTKEKDMEKEYKVVGNGFTLKDIWDKFKSSHSCPEFQREWGKLLSEYNQQGEHFNHRFKNFKKEDSWATVKNYKTLMNNLHHLERGGLLEEVEKDVVLKEGMRLKSLSYIVVVVLDGYEEKLRLLVFDESSDKFKMYSDKRFRVGITLSQLNKRMSVKFEVIDE